MSLNPSRLIRRFEVIGVFYLTFIGFLLGLSSRVWMRLVSKVPEFSWSGTTFIVGAFTSFAFFQGLLLLARERKYKLRKIAIFRVFALISTAPLFVGAGASMAPFLIFGSVLRWRKNQKRLVVILIIILISNFISVSYLQFHENYHPAELLFGSLGLLMIYLGLIQFTEGWFTSESH